MRNPANRSKRRGAAGRSKRFEKEYPEGALFFDARRIAEQFDIDISAVQRIEFEIKPHNAPDDQALGGYADRNAKGDRFYLSFPPWYLEQARYDIRVRVVK